MKVKFLILALEIAWLALAFGLFFHSTASFLETSAGNASSADTSYGADKTYTNGQYGFSLRYPDTLQLATRAQWNSLNSSEVKTGDAFFYDTSADSISLTATTTSRFVDTDSDNGTVVYYFDAKKNAWMMDTTKADPTWLLENSLTPGVQPALEVFASDGGLPVFAGTESTQTDIVALNPHTFVVLNTLVVNSDLTTVEDEMAMSLTASSSAQ